jgi:hypothetical protein
VLRIVPGNQDDPLGVWEWDWQKVQPIRIDHDDAFLERIRHVHATNLPDASAFQRVAQGGCVRRIGERKLNTLHHPGLLAGADD